MLVEDEEFVLEKLEKTIEWKAQNLKIVYKARHALEAFNRLQCEKVDIIITDICMPMMSGLELLGKVRESDSITRFIIISRYNDFEFARAAIHLDIEGYILKPIKEKELLTVLQSCVKKLEDLEKERNSHIDEKAGLLRFLSGRMGNDEATHYVKTSELADFNSEEGSLQYAAIMKVAMEKSMKEHKLTDIIRSLKEERFLHTHYLRGNNFLLILHLDGKSAEDARNWFANLQNKIETSKGIMSFITVSDAFQDLTCLPEIYKTLTKMQKYLPIDGYGSCINEARIRHKTNTDVTIDREKFSALVYRKDVAEASRYLEDIFINTMDKDASIDVLYHIAMKIAIILQEIKIEYKLEPICSERPLSELINNICMAENILNIKALFVSEVAEIASHLNCDSNQYTPIVRQIMAEAKENFRSNLSLKTLACKYHANASYLGQIFQKEVGCSFSQYLSDIKNSVAKDLILTTTMRINDIVKEAGYTDASYFYRKFKQCYGVSPAAMREMKKH